MPERAKESWDSRAGAILAVAGSAVGLGNFLRFPGLAAQFSGGAFMIAYFCALLLLGIPLCWAEWTMGRKGGDLGYNSYPAILAAITGRNWLKWVGVLGVVVPVGIYMYYVYIEAWCLGYAVNFVAGNLHFQTIGESAGWWANFIGVARDGSALHFGPGAVGFYLLLVIVLNFLLIYRGLAKGIEWFCKYAMPALVVIALVLLARVLTLGAPDPAHPERSVINGLGYMWNPEVYALQQQDPADGSWRTLGEFTDPLEAGRVRDATASNLAPAATGSALRIAPVPLVTQLLNPELWLAAAGQIFFSLSVGFGIILNYSSYLRRRDDVVLSGLTACSANEFCEVALGGMITIPAAYVFLGAAGLAGAGLGTFDLGFKVLPMVFSQMPAGAFFGALFFFLLFLAAITSSLSMLQPAIAFLEEAWRIQRRASVTILGFITCAGTLFVWYFSADAKALDTIDFWAGTFLIYVLATVQSLVFIFGLGVDAGWKLAHEGAAIRMPRPYKFVMRWLTPFYLLIVFGLWVLVNVLGFQLGGGERRISGYVRDLFLEPNRVAQMSLGVLLLTAVFTILVIASSKTFQTVGRPSPAPERKP